ncbi:unnamed protein product [Agarophyton chilense]|eukprot:gb/GEZJ01001978.1/.p1 GENE.gb/GEZJ01001978.1/~~gb/GEZJ01001978.1/.p1  ORF type:complete len:635 (+),score=71.82 gb/GEZJ01001978.1/:2584-4488(+)
MVGRYRGLRAELSSILAVDEYAQRPLRTELPPPTDSISAHLAHLISRATEHPDEARTVYAYLPSIMLRIFGFAPGQGWLETCSELRSRDRDALVAIVLPDGPLHTFCNKHSPPRSKPIDFVHDMLFEFPRRNLPTLTNHALQDGDLSPRTSTSYLASLLAPSLRNTTDDMVFLTPLHYFFICMIASPTLKYVNAPVSQSVKGPKRSKSIPSIRAQYNQLISAYAALSDPSSPFNAQDIFIPTCLDYWIIPWLTATPTNLPYLSTSTADALATLLLALPPASPRDLDLSSESCTLQVTEMVPIRLLTTSGAVYRFVPPMLHVIFSNFDSASPIFPLNAYIRVLALMIAPWRHNIRATASHMLLPKPKIKKIQNPNRSPSMSAWTTTLSSINAHLPSATSPGNATSVKEGEWREKLEKRYVKCDKSLLRSAVILAAKMHVASSPDGVRVLSLLTDAAQAARFQSITVQEEDSDRMEELQLCLDAVADQRCRLNRTNGHREKNFIPILAANLGDKPTNGMLRGISEMVGVGSGKVVSAVNGVGSSNTKRRLKDFRNNWMGKERGEEVPFIGDVWDKPISGNESEMLVLFAYWLALKMEPRLGFLPDIRFLGQYWVWCMTVLICIFIVLMRNFVSSLT